VLTITALLALIFLAVLALVAGPVFLIYAAGAASIGAFSSWWG
jgi:hypothetical protein